MKKNYTFITDVKYLIGPLKEDIKRYNRLLNALSLLGNFDSKIKLTVKDNYNNKLIYTIDKDNNIFSFYSDKERNVKKRYELFMKENSIIKQYNFNEKIILEKIGYYLDNNILWITSKELNFELEDNITYNLYTSKNLDTKTIVNIIKHLKKKKPSFEEFINIIRFDIDFENFNNITLSKKEKNDIIMEEYRYYKNILVEKYIKEIKVKELKKDI